MPVPAKPFNQMNSDDRWAWQQESKLYEWSYKIYERERNAMTAMWTAIQTSVSQNHRYILNLDISERQRMIKLRDKLKPDDLCRMAKLIDRFEKLGEKKRNESVEEWLSEWENVVHECEDAGLVGYSGYWASLKFIKATGPLLPRYAKVRHANLDPDSTPGILEEISTFRHRNGNFYQTKRSNPALRPFNANPTYQSIQISASAFAVIFIPSLTVHMSYQVSALPIGRQIQRSRQSSRRLRRREKT